MKTTPKKQKKGEMARKLVYLCISIMIIALIWAMVLKTVALFIEVTIDISDILTFVSVSFGGELLLLLLKRIFAKKEERNSDENANDEV